VVVEGIIGIRSFRLSLYQTFLIKVDTFVALSLQSRYNDKTIMIDEQDCIYVYTLVVIKAKRTDRVL
jgi:hypothetical protein